MHRRAATVAKSVLRLASVVHRHVVQARVRLVGATAAAVCGSIRGELHLMAGAGSDSGFWVGAHDVPVPGAILVII